MIWKNYEKNPNEDKQGYFAYSFKQDGKAVIIPAHSTGSTVNNVDAKSSKILNYTIPILQKGDSIEVGLYVQLTKSDCVKVIKLDDKSLTEAQLMKKVTTIQK